MIDNQRGMNEITVWYDGACPLCLREIRWMDNLDKFGLIRFVDLANPETNYPLDRRLMLNRLHVQENVTILSGVAAFAAMWRAVPLLRPIGIIACNRLVLHGLEWGYRMLLGIRPLLQRLVGERIAS